MKSKKIFILTVVIISFLMINSEKAFASDMTECVGTSNETVSVDDISEDNDLLPIDDIENIDFVGTASDTYFSLNDIKTVSGKTFETPADVYFIDSFWGGRKDVSGIIQTAQYQILSIKDVSINDSEIEGYTDMTIDVDINIYASYIDSRKNHSSLSFGWRTSYLGLVDKYTGSMLASKWLTGDDSYENTSDIEIDEKKYSIYYKKTTKWSEDEENYSESCLTGFHTKLNIKYIVSYPKEYDGLAFYIDRAGKSIGDDSKPNWDDKVLLDKLDVNNLYVVNINSDGNEDDEKTYKIKYFENGAESGVVPCGEVTHLYDSKATVFGNIGNLKKNGYKFIGWSTDSSATEAEYKEGDILTVNQDILLYAIWKRAFTQGFDNNNFIHGASEEEYGFYGKKNYGLDEDYKNKLFSYCITRGERLKIVEDIDSEWSGSCFGIASTMGLLYDGYINEKEMSDNAEIGSGYYSLPKPADDSRMMNVIMYYQLSQRLIALRKQDGIYDSKKKLDTKKQQEWLEGLMETVKKYTTVGLCEWYKKSDGKMVGHCILVVDYEYDSINKRYVLTLYDENYHNKDAYSKMYINDDYSNFSIENHKAIYGLYYTDWDLYELVGFNDIGSLNVEEDISSNYSEISSDKEVITLIVDADKSFEIVNDKGEKLTYSEQSFSGDLAIKNFYFTTDFKNGTELTLEIDNTEYVDLKPLTKYGIGFGLYSDMNYMHVSATGVSSAKYNIDKSIELDGQNINFDVVMSADRENDYLENITGKSTKGISFVSVDGGIDINAEDKATDVTKKVIDGDAVSVEEIGNIEWLDFVKKNSDGSYTMNLATKQKVVVAELGKTGANDKNYKVTYADSTKKKCATISSKGVIAAKKVGRSDITIMKNGKNIKVTVNVYDPKFKYAGTKKQYSVNVGENIKPDYDNCKLKTEFYIPAKQQKYATVDSKTGKVIAIKKGKVTLTASVGEGKNARKVTARIKIYNPTIVAKKSVDIGKSIKLKIKDGEKNTKWSIIKGQEFARIDSNGKLTGIAQGTVTIKAINNGKVLTTEITIK